MNESDYAALIYCNVFGVTSDNGDTYTRGVLNAIGTLDTREQTALESYYRHGKTFEQTGKELGNIKKEAARQIVEKALLKLRHPTRAQQMSVTAIISARDKLLSEANDMINNLYSQIERCIAGAPLDSTTLEELELRKASIAKARFSSRTHNHLISAGIKSLEALSNLASLDILMERHNFGKKSRDEIIVKMRELGYREWADRMEKP